MRFGPLPSLRRRRSVWTLQFSACAASLSLSRGSSGKRVGILINGSYWSRACGKKNKSLPHAQLDAGVETGRSYLEPLRTLRVYATACAPGSNTKAQNRAEPTYDGLITVLKYVAGRSWTRKG